MQLKRLLAIILSPLVLGSYSASAVRRIPNMVKTAYLKENKDLSPKKKRSRRKKNKVVSDKVDRSKKLKNRIKGKTPLVDFRDNFIEGSKRVGRFIKKNPGKSALAAIAVVGILDRLPDFFADDDRVFEQTKNYLIKNAIREKVCGHNGSSVASLVGNYFWWFGGGFKDEVERYFAGYKKYGIGFFGQITQGLKDIAENQLKMYPSDKKKAVEEAVKEWHLREIEAAEFVKNDILSQEGFEKWKSEKFSESNVLKLSEELSKNEVAFEKIHKKYFSECNEDRYKSDPCLLVRTLVKELRNVGANTYSIPHTALRRLWDFFLMRGATTRQRKSAERILYNGKAEGFGSCWELANIVDWFCRKLKFERHNIIAYKLGPGIYHTFNFFVCKDKAYLADPLGGIVKKLELGKDESLLKALEDFRYRNLFNGINPGYGDWYAVEQIKDNTYRTLGMMKLARFFPNISDGGRLFKLHGECRDPYCREHYECNRYINIDKLDTSNKSSFIVKDESGNLVWNDEKNIKFDDFSSPLFG